MTELGNPAFNSMACVILAAGQGTRMKSSRRKVLHKVAGKPMIRHVLDVCEVLSPQKKIVVVSEGAEDVAVAAAPASCCVQREQLGTGDAVKAARELLRGFSGDVMVLFGDTPLLLPSALKSLAQKRMATGAAIVVAGFTAEDNSYYGRIILDESGMLKEIVEAKDANEEQKKINLCNGGIMLFAAEKLWPLLDGLENKNAKGEYYLTDCVRLAVSQGWKCAVTEIEEESLLGVNDRIDLAKAERIMQQRLRLQAMANGVTMTCPESVHLSADTKIGRDVTIEPNVFIGEGVEIGDNVIIRAFSYLEGAKIESGAAIGPFARLRAGTSIGKDAHIGNFVEIKKTEVRAGAKINHLSYVGDAVVGEKANVGAGTITCNYDGFEKSRTEIGAGAFIGSNSALVAPVKVGDGAYVGAGSAVTMDVPDNALAVARGRQSNFENWAKRFRDSKKSGQ